MTNADAPNGHVRAVGGDRYSRQSRFWAIGTEGQARIRQGHVAVVGCGALGSAAADLLARGGIGEMTLVDRDVVEIGNLHRQLLFDEADAAAGAPKAVAAARAIARINSDVVLHPIVADVTPANVERIVADADVVLDGTDNFETRYLVNDACVKLGKPWIYGGAIGSTGMVMPIVPGETPCLRCAFPTPPAAGALGTCDTVGVVASCVVAVAAIQWTEAIKLLVGDRESLCTGLTAFDVWSNDHFAPEAFERSPDCPCCGHARYDYLDASVTSQTLSLCGRDAVQVSPGRSVTVDLRGLAGRLEAVGDVECNEYLVRCQIDSHEITVFADGRAIVKGTTDLAVARSLYARYVGI